MSDYAYDNLGILDTLAISSFIVFCFTIKAF